MSVYQEFAGDIERRQARLSRRQMWVRAQLYLKRRNLAWMIALTVVLFILGASLLGAAMFPNSPAQLQPTPTGKPWSPDGAEIKRA